MGGNYAASLRANKKAHDLGYSCEFYLDAKEKKYIDECGAANFFGIKNNTYITPKSSSILPSITNKSLMQLAEDLGIKVECRPVPEEELETFEEAGAWKTRNRTLSLKMESRVLFVQNCITNCVLFSMVMNLIHIIG